MYSFLLGSQAFQAWFPSVKYWLYHLFRMLFCAIFQNFTPVWCMADFTTFPVI